MSRSAAVLAFLLLAGTAGAADRTAVWSLTDLACATCSVPAQNALKKAKGVRAVEFDRKTVELKVSGDFADTVVTDALKKAGVKAVAGAGKGTYALPAGYAAGADALVLTNDGSKVGPLEKLRVAGKYTVFDFYAEWCAPCKLVDERLRKITGHRKDVAVRKLDVVDFDSELAEEIGDNADGLPYVVIFTPNGGRTEFTGSNFSKLDAALGEK